MKRTDNHIINEINRMNQRGGKMLSVIDLIKEGTVSIDLAAHLITLIQDGISIAAGSRIGGVGKTTLLASLLGFLPPESILITVTERSMWKYSTPVIHRPTIFLCHEVSPAHYFSYLWENSLKPYIELSNKHDSYIAFTIHADTREEMYPQIVNSRSGLHADDFCSIDLLIFIKAVPTSAGNKRRVTMLYEKDTQAQRHICTYRYNPELDAVTRIKSSPIRKAYDSVKREKITSILVELLQENIYRIENVRESFFSRFN